MEQEQSDILETVRGYYSDFDESKRFSVGSFKLEFARTCSILARCLPLPPTKIYDIGGGPGAYAVWLAERGFIVDLLDPVESHVSHARSAKVVGSGMLRAHVGDARALPYPDNSSPAALLLGPLYHLPNREDRLQSLRECFRVLKPGGILVAAAISRYASTLAGLFEGAFADPNFRQIAAQDRATGQHRNKDRVPSYFTTGFFHHPDELRSEVEAAGFRVDEICAVEGPAGLLPDFDRAWDDPTMRAWVIETAEAFESEPAALAVSNHFLAIATRP